MQKILRKIEHKSGKKQNILRKLECRGWQFTLHGRFFSLDAKQSIIAKVKFGGTHLHTDISMDIDELASLRIQPRNGFTARWTKSDSEKVLFEVLRDVNE